MFDSVLSLFVKQLGGARFAYDGDALVVQFQKRPGVRVVLPKDEAKIVAEGALRLCQTIAAITAPQNASPPAAEPILAKQEASTAKAAPAKPKPSKK